MRGRVVLACLALAAIGCRPDPPPPSSTSSNGPPAKVQNAKPETELATITLKPEAEAHLALKTAEVKMEDASRSRTVGGEAMARPGFRVVVSAPVAGTVSAPSGRSPAVGRVERGDVVFELVPLSQSDRDVRAEAQRKVKETDARLAEASLRLARLEQLLKDGSTSRRAVEEARAAKDVAAAAAESARIELETSSRLPMGPKGELSITSPYRGVISAVHAAPGQAVAAGAPLFEAADIDTVWIRVPLYAGDIGSVDAGKPAFIGTLGQEDTGAWREATPVAGPPSATPASSSADIFFQLPNPKSAIRPGERVSVRLALKGTIRALVVPRSAVIYDVTGGSWVYEVKAPHTYARRRIEVTGQSGPSVIVGRGLAEGVKIVTVGAAELYSTEFFVNK
jgi:RND family efflux transporter MFP subunit